MAFDPTALAVYLVTDHEICATAGHSVAETVSAAVIAGVRTVQVRAKDAATGQYLAEVLEVDQAIRSLNIDGVLLFVNDRVDVALAAHLAGANIAGVHLGQSDLPTKVARQLLWTDALIGLSVSNLNQLRAADDSVDYFGIGPLYSTPTKTDTEAALGLAGCAELAAATSVPSVTIGGVKDADLAGIRAVGFAGGAVVSAICGVADPGQAAAQLLTTWQEVIHR